MELEESIKIAIENHDVKLYDIVITNENKNNIFRVFITKENGVDLDVCAKISQIISPLLDIHEPIRGKYSLEVSSPGIERKLKNINHFRCSIGENVKIKDLSMNITKGKLIFVSSNNTISIEDKNSEIKKLNYKDILSASTYYDWKNKIK
jgi:ribosome maturation factor RimP